MQKLIFTRAYNQDNRIISLLARKGGGKGSIPRRCYFWDFTTHTLYITWLERLIYLLIQKEKNSKSENISNVL